MVDVLLIDPKPESCNRELEENTSLQLLEIEAYLRSRNYSTYLINLRKEQISPKEAAEKVAKYSPLVIFVWVMYRSLGYSLSFFKELGRVLYGKSLQRPIVIAAGYAATFSAVDLLEKTSRRELDAILLGEAEESLAEVVRFLHRGTDWKQVPGLIYRNIAGHIRRSPRRDLPSTPDKFPMPYRHESRFSSDQWVEIRGSRGCYHNCSFCNVGAFYGTANGPRWRGYSVSRMLQEIRYLYEKGARRFYFVDDQFFGPGKEGIERVRRFALSLLDLGLDIEWQIFCRVDNVEREIFQLMRQAGLTVVNIGIEGGSQTQLDRMNKRQTVSQIIQAVDLIRRLGITLIPSFIMFDPYVALEEIEANIKLIKQLDFITYLGPNCTIPFPGTSLTKRMTADDLLDVQNPIIPDFLPSVRMVNPEVALLYNVWQSWRSWIDGSFDNLETKLAKAAYAYQVSASSWLGKELETLYSLARRLKSLEADYIYSCIRNIREGSSQGELIALRSQYTDAISSIALAVPQEYQPDLILRKEMSNV